MLSMQHYLNDVTYISVLNSGRKEPEKLVEPSKVIDFKQPCGECLWLGSAVFPQASVSAFFLQQSLQHVKF